MSNEERQRFQDALGRTLLPMLRADGFTGSGQTMRRLITPVIQVINIQGSRYGGSCCVNLGLHLQFLPTSLGEVPKFKTFTEPLCWFRRRLAQENESDHWWEYGSSEAEACSSASDLVATYSERGAPHFARWTEFPGRFLEVTVERLAQGDHGCLPARLTAVSAALAMARIHAHLANADLARAFASFGLANLGRATGLTSGFDEVLSRIGGSNIGPTVV